MGATGALCYAPPMSSTSGSRVKPVSSVWAVNISVDDWSCEVYRASEADAAELVDDVLTAAQLRTTVRFELTSLSGRTIVSESDVVINLDHARATRAVAQKRQLSGGTPTIKR